jgi:ubiquinone/menaquinone biosynthesis C-methylase UbiE
MSETRPLSSSPTNPVFTRIEKLITNEDGLEWLRLLFQLDDGATHILDDRRADELIALGICGRAPEGISLTPFGRKCADSVREYIFWIERHKKIHWEDKYQCLRLENFRDKDVLEIGPGWGCNLVRLAEVARSAKGVELEPVYIEFGRLFAKREGFAPPEIVLGAAENTTFGAETFDWVFIWSALQFTNIDETLRECSRVLRPNGYVLARYPLFFQSVWEELRNVKRRPRSLLSIASMVTNTIWYQVFRTRLRKNVKSSSTARPIYVTKHHLIATSKSAGFQYRGDLSVHSGNLFLLVLQKPLKLS